MCNEFKYYHICTYFLFISTALNKIIKYISSEPSDDPQWGLLSAINVSTGKIIWQVPLGYYESLKLSNKNTGTENFGGATAKWTSKSDSASNFASDRPILRSVRLKIIKDNSSR